MKPTVRRAGTALAAGALVASALVAVTPTAASADPGFCGVRVNTQGYPGGFLYTGRNKCSSSHKFRAVVLGHGLQCETLAPSGGVYTWWSVSYDPNWYLQAC
jgi:hypothetical protein